MLPVLVVPGDWICALAPEGSPCTVSVTEPVLPVRVSVIVRVPGVDSEACTLLGTQAKCDRVGSSRRAATSAPPQPDGSRE